MIEAEESNRITKNERNVYTLVYDFCLLLVSTDDEIKKNRLNDLFKSLSEEEKTLLSECSENERKDIEWYILGIISLTTDSSNSDTTCVSFGFIANESYTSFKGKVEKIYGSELPKMLNVAFDRVWEIGEHYYIYEKFFAVNVEKSSDNAIRKAQEEAKNIAEEIAKQTATRQVDLVLKGALVRFTNETNTQSEDAAEKAAKKAATKAEILAEKAAESAKKAAGRAVDEKMQQVTEKISETSVVILGIFAGIVLTVVAGLFYSSSVLDNITDTNIYKLTFVSSLIGFVCINLLAIMFNYVDKFRHRESEKDVDLYNKVADNDTNNASKQKFAQWCKQKLYPKFEQHLFVIILNSILLIMICFSGYKVGLDEEQLINETKYNTNISVDLNMPNQNINELVSITQEPIPTEMPGNNVSVTVSPIDTENIEDLIPKTSEGM